MTALRVCFVGDSITAGTADAEVLGWPGRLGATELARGHDLTVYNLGVRGETSTQIADRWRAEAGPRLPDDVDGALVFAFGINDSAIEPDVDPDAPRVPVERSVATARRILEAAARWRPTVMIGPAPIHPDGATIVRSAAVTYRFDNARSRTIDAAYAELTADLGVPYLRLFPRLQADADWRAALAAGDGVHPSADGYRLIAGLVGDWPAWRGWLES